MFGIRGKQKKLDLMLPAAQQPYLGASPSQRIMAVAHRRAMAYGLLIASLISVAFNILFAVLMISRIEVIPYVADGSSYGCSPQIVSASAIPQISGTTPFQSEVGTLAPLPVDIQGDN